MTISKFATRKRDTGPQDFEPRYIPLDRLEPPPAGEVHAWFLDLGWLARSLRGALDGHVGPRDPAPFTAGQLKFTRRFYLRLLLGAYLGIPGKSVRINRRNRGKPVLDATVHPEQLCFSMAKSEDRVLIGFATSVHVGVDLEPLGRRALKPLGLANRYFSAVEAAALAALAALDPAALDAAFLRAWACKEAVVKASGQGIANQLSRFTVEIDPARPARVLDYEGDRAEAWSLALLRPEEGFLGAVAARCASLDIHSFRLLPAAGDAAN
jgi:4'-phosphopantetheinyl transferase